MAEPVVALTGGTAINLFEWNLPRLSVESDLTYLPDHDLKESLGAFGDALERIGTEIERRLPPVWIFDVGS